MTGIVVITYNSERVIGPCLDACIKAGDVEIVVVDNASQDATRSLARKRADVRIIANPTNLGFAAAANQGIAALRTDCVLLLNPDAVLQTRLTALTEVTRQPGVGAAGGQLVNLDGSAQHGFNVRKFPSPSALISEALGLNRLWPNNPINRRYRQNLSSACSADVDQPAAAFLMIKRRVWEAVGGFDEGFYPVWFEDVDFCKRVKDAGFRIMYVPDAIAVHEGGHSAGKLPWKFRQLVWYASLLRYASKHYSAVWRRLVSLAVILACFPRMIAGVVTQATLEPVSVYSRVVWLASLYLRKGECRISYTAAATNSRPGSGPVMM